jgi:hypothetical protein
MFLDFQCPEAFSEFSYSGFVAERNQARTIFRNLSGEPIDVASGGKTRNDEFVWKRINDGESA